jgi:hypothetical protein
VIAFTFSEVIGIPSLVRKSRAHPTESTPARFSEPELVGTLPSVVVVPVVVVPGIAAAVVDVPWAWERASANELVPVVEPASVALGSDAVAVLDAPRTPPAGVRPNWLLISWMRASTAAMPSIEPDRRPPATAEDYPEVGSGVLEI